MSQLELDLEMNQQNPLHFRSKFVNAKMYQPFSILKKIQFQIGLIDLNSEN